MAKLIYTANTSLDGYTADEHGNFDFTTPSAEVHAYINDRLRGIGTFLFGRRMYETMRVWENLPTEGEPEMEDFAGLWRAADKIVYSTSLSAVTTGRTRLVREFVPSDIHDLKENSDTDVSIGGPGLAALAIEAGLVDEFEVFVSPVSVGGGTRYLPDHVRLDLELVTEHRFDNGTVHLGYRLRR